MGIMMRMMCRRGRRRTRDSVCVCVLGTNQDPGLRTEKEEEEEAM